MECSTNTSAGDSGPICMWDFYRCSLCSCMPLPSHHLRWTSLSPDLFSSLLLLKFSFCALLLLLLCSLTLHLSTWQVTRSGPPADWLIRGLSYLSIFFQSHAKPDQAGPDHVVGWPRAQIFFFFLRQLLRKLSEILSLVSLQHHSGYGSSPRPQPDKPPN